MDELDVALERRETSRAEMRANLQPDVREYVLQLEETARLERAYAADPDSDARRDQAKAGREALEASRAAFDKARARELAAHTKRLK